MERLDKAFSTYCQDPKFNLWLDRQKRPTVGVKVQRGGETRRPDVKNDTFIRMMKALTSTCESLIPNSLTHVYFTYSMGEWQRSRDFHLKAHVTTAVFLSLTDKLCEQHSLGANPLRNRRVIAEMEKRERNDHRGDKLRELLEIEDRNDLHRENNFYIATIDKPDYPLLCLYQIKGGEKTTAISVEQLPEALGILETFVEKCWKQRGFAIGMVVSPKSASVAGPSPLSFQIAAIVDEREFAARTGKDEDAVIRSWGWVEPEREYH